LLPQTPWWWWPDKVSQAYCRQSFAGLGNSSHKVTATEPALEPDSNFQLCELYAQSGPGITSSH
jgi:hypothetical protein